MKKVSLAILLLAHVFVFGQVGFEKGYFITNTGERVECLIKNAQSLNTPSSFKYRKSKEDATQIINLIDVQELAIFKQVKYIRRTVKLDQSSDELSQLSTSPNPEWIEREVLLKELVSGNVKLYSFTDNSMKRFFYQVATGNIEPLIFKPYALNGGKVAYNEDYKSQLQEVLVCSTINEQLIQDLAYTERRLVDVFTTYYRCSNPSLEPTVMVKRRGKLTLAVRPRINSNSMDLQHRLFNNRFPMEDKISLGLGVELEYVLPFNKSKWAILVEPQYQAYQSETVTDVDYVVGGKLVTKVNYKSIGLPIGLRHYMYTGNQSRFFVNIQYAFNFAMNSSIQFRRGDGTLERTVNLKSEPNLAFGLGYKYKQFGVEARYFTNANINKEDFLWETTYRHAALIFSYQLF